MPPAPPPTGWPPSTAPAWSPTSTPCCTPGEQPSGPASTSTRFSLASLIVAIATLAWTIYADLRNKTPQPSPGVVARHVRAELRNQSDTSRQDTDRITQIVVTEIIQAAREPG